MDLTVFAFHLVALPEHCVGKGSETDSRPQDRVLMLTNNVFQRQGRGARDMCDYCLSQQRFVRNRLQESVFKVTTLLGDTCFQGNKEPLSSAVG